MKNKMDMWRLEKIETLHTDSTLRIGARKETSRMCL